MRDIHMSTRRFVEQVKQGYDSNLRYCFILGSGASYTSGIPTGLKLMPEWHKFLQDQGMEYIKECAGDCGISDDTLERIFKPGYQFQSEDYFPLFDLRFAGMPVVAYKYLQDLMEDAEPSIGYYMLAVLMDNTENKLVITTNFDSLVEDVLYMYHATKHPLVAGHESLAPFIGTVENMGRPVVAKVHRDLNLHPLNREKELNKLADDWAENLHTAFSKYIPIVIGYAGGDQTLMNLLEKTNLESIYWCSLNDSESERIEKLLRGCPRGYLVKIKGFDDVMFRLVSRMTEGKSFDKPVDRMKSLFQSRIDNYNKQYLDIENKFTEEETGRGSEKVIPSKDLKGCDDPYDTSDNGISVSGNKVASAESDLELLDKMASTDDSPALRVAALRRAAVKHYFDGDIDQAVKCCDKAIRIQPEAADLYNLKGTVLNNVGRYKESLEGHDEAVRLAPDNAGYHYARGVTLHGLGRYEDALKEYDEAVRLDPDNARYHHARGVTLNKLGRYEDALKEYDEAVRLDPDNAEYHNSRGVAFYELSRYEDALKEYDEAIRLDPDNARYHNSRGVALHELGRYEDALKEKDETVRQDPDNARYHNSRGVTLHRLGRYEDALKEYDEAVRLDPDNARYRNNRSRILHILGRYEEAMEESNEADRLDSENTRNNVGREKRQ